MEAVRFTTSASVMENLQVRWCMCVPYPALESTTPAADGLLSLKDDVLTVEFQTLFPGGRKSEVERIGLTIDQVDSLALDRELLQTTLHLRVKSLELLKGLPGMRAGVAKLRVSRQDRENAKRLARHIRRRLSELELEDLDRELAELTSP